MLRCNLFFINNLLEEGRRMLKTINVGDKLVELSWFTSPEFQSWRYQQIDWAFDGQMLENKVYLVSFVLHDHTVWSIRHTIWKFV